MIIVIVMNKMINKDVNVGMRVQWRDCVKGQQRGTVLQAMPFKEGEPQQIAGQYFKINVDEMDATYSQKKRGYIEYVIAGLLDTSRE